MFWDSAERLNAKGLAFEEAGDSARAEVFYTRALEKKPAWSVPWYNLGLLHKRRRAWAESLEFNRRATELNPDDEAAWWNLGIAATALSEWAVARAAWKGFGLELPEGEGSLNLSMGLVPIRLNSDDRGEVVWCERIDPARALIRSVPLPEAGHHCGDLLLHDGEPTGKRIRNGKEVPVFNAIEILEPSSLATFSVALAAPGDEDLTALCDLAFERELAAEDWSTIRWICRACSEGSPGEHEYCSQASWSEKRSVAIAAPDVATTEDLLADWAGSGAGRSFERVKSELPL